MTSGNVKIIQNGKLVFETSNTLTNLYRNYIARFLGGESPSTSVYAAMGVGTTAAQVTDTNLDDELVRQETTYKFTRLTYYSRLNTLFNTLTPPIPPGSAHVAITEIGLFDAGPITVLNHSFENWTSGTPDSWTFNGLEASMGSVAADVYDGTASVQVVASAADESMFQYIGGSPGTPAGTPSFADLRGEVLDFVTPAKCAGGSAVRSYIADGVGTSYSSYHTGSGIFERLRSSRVVDNAATKVEIGVVFGTPGTANVDWVQFTDRGNLLARAIVDVEKGSGEAANIMWEIFQEEF